jgi:hypothetical protein
MLVFFVFLSLVQEIEIRIIQVGDKTTIGYYNIQKARRCMQQQHLEVKEICIPLCHLLKAYHSVTHAQGLGYGIVVVVHRDLILMNKQKIR